MLYDSTYMKLKILHEQSAVAKPRVWLLWDFEGAVTTEKEQEKRLGVTETLSPHE